MANKTIAEQIQFQLQFMGMMKMCGRNEMADTAYIKAQELTAELIELEKLSSNLERVGSWKLTNQLLSLWEAIAP